VSIGQHNTGANHERMNENLFRFQVRIRKLLRLFIAIDLAQHCQSTAANCVQGLLPKAVTFKSSN